jgi:cobyrinic acid a,c-diamide synthase
VRHLGLHGAAEAGAPAGHAAFARAVAEQLYVDAALRLARAGAVARAPAAVARRAAGVPRCRIAVARDEAFCFYYEDNLELLRDAGAELVEWSPLAAHALPGDVDGLYLGGGYPELHARRLEAASALRREVRDFAARGGMVYAECGGFMYLQRAIRLADGSEAEMVGLFPGVAAMQPRLVAIGYREHAMTVDGRTLVVRGQEFRHSRLAGVPEHVTIDGEEAVPAAAGGSDGAPLAWRRVLAGYTHLHFGGTPELAELLVARAAAFRSARG